ncbi:hypothetical protein [Pelagibaculum spongiae]|nr:hypothetical protein [Pelagibaculum spongiae]
MLIVLGIGALVALGAVAYRKWQKLNQLVTQLTPDDGSWIG